MNFRCKALFLVALSALCDSCRGDFAAEVQLNTNPKFTLYPAWFFANNGWGSNAVARDAFIGKDPNGSSKRVSVSLLARAEIAAGKGERRSVTVFYRDGEREELQDVNLAFIYGKDKRGSQIAMSLFDKTGVITLYFLPFPPALPGAPSRFSP